MLAVFTLLSISTSRFFSLLIKPQIVLSLCVKS